MSSNVEDYFHPSVDFLEPLSREIQSIIDSHTGRFESCGQSSLKDLLSALHTLFSDLMNADAPIFAGDDPDWCLISSEWRAPAWERARHWLLAARLTELCDDFKDRTVRQKKAIDRLYAGVVRSPGRQLDADDFNDLELDAYLDTLESLSRTLRQHTPVTTTTQESKSSGRFTSEQIVPDALAPAFANATQAIESLSRLVEAVDDFLESGQTSEGDDPDELDVESVETGGAIHRAITELQACYGGKLPAPEPHNSWIGLQRACRREIDPTTRQVQAHECAGELRDWACSQMGQIGFGRVARQSETPNPVAGGEIVSVHDFLHALDSIEAEMQQIPDDVHVEFSLTRGQMTGKTEDYIERTGRHILLLCLRTVRAHWDDGWVDIGGQFFPFVWCLEDSSLRDSFPPDLSSELENAEFAVWFYLDAFRTPVPDHLVPDDVELEDDQLDGLAGLAHDNSRFTNIHRSLRNALCFAPEVLLREFGNVLQLPTGPSLPLGKGESEEMWWPTVLFYLAARQADVVLNVNAAPHADQDFLDGLPDADSEEEYVSTWVPTTWTISLSPSCMLAATRYALRAFRRIAERVNGQQASSGQVGGGETTSQALGNSQPTSSTTPFVGGEIVFYPDRVELCGVDICSGTRTKKYRVTLKLLAKKDGNGAFKAYSCEDLAKLVGISPEETDATKREVNAAGHIRHLRRRISKLLQVQANLACGDEDVIQTGKQGYRFAECLSVQFVDEPAITDITDIDASGDVRNVRDDDVRDVFDVRDDASASRQSWILQQLTEHVKLKVGDVARHFKCSERTARRDLTALKDEGKIEYVGAPRTGYYRLCQPPPTDQ